MKTISEDSGRLIWHMNNDSPKRLIALEDIATKIDEPRDMYRLSFGAVIDREGQLWKLDHYAVHGIASAILYPDLAERFGVGAPRLNPPHQAYQEFENEVQHLLPLVRISTRFMINISFGRCEAWPNQSQITTLERFLVFNDAMTDKLWTGLSEFSGYSLLRLLREGEPEPGYCTDKTRKALEEMAKDPDRYKPFDPAEWY